MVLFAGVVSAPYLGPPPIRNLDTGSQPPLGSAFPSDSPNPRGNFRVRTRLSSQGSTEPWLLRTEHAELLEEPGAKRRKHPGIWPNLRGELIQPGDQNYETGSQCTVYYRLATPASGLWPAVFRFPIDRRPQPGVSGNGSADGSSWRKIPPKQALPAGGSLPGKVTFASGQRQGSRLI